MTAPNRAALLTKAHKILKKHYEPVSPPSDRTVLEHLLYACCVENAGFEAADEAFAKLQESYFDWNEVRVTTVAELSESMTMLPDPAAAATRLKNALQSVFETHYSFDIDFLRKQNIGKSVKELEKFKGATRHVISYLTQNALGGHAIGVDEAALRTMAVLGIATEADVAKERVPGMERAIPKTKGVEFYSLLHQVSADFHASPFGQRVRSILQEIAPDAKDRFPKRVKPKAAEKSSSKRTKKAAAKSKSDKATTTKNKTAKKKVAKKAPAAGKKKSATKRLAKKKPR